MPKKLKSSRASLVEVQSLEAATPRHPRQVLEAIPDGMVIIDRDWRFSYANRRAREILGDAELVGHSLFERFPGNLSEPYQSSYRTTMEKGRPTEFEAFYPDPLNLWFNVQARPYDDGIIIFFSDITLRKEFDLREQEMSRRFAQVLDVSSDAVVSIDRDWRITFLNTKARALIDPEGKLLGVNVWEAFPGTRPGPLWDNYHRTMNEGVSTSFEIFYPEPLHAFHTIRCQPSPEGIVVFFSDATAQRAHDRVVRQQQELLAVVQQASRAATWEFDVGTEKITFGPGSFEVFGHPLSSLGDLRSFQAILAPGHVETLRVNIEGAVRTGDTSVYEFAVLGADSTLVWIESRAQAIAAPDGHVYLRGMSIDITKRKADEAQLIASETRYRVLADLNPQMIWMGGPDGNITYANQRILTYVGLTFEEFSGAGWLHSVHPDDQARVTEVWAACVATGKDYDVEALLRSAATGQYRYCHVRAAPVRDASGAILHWLGVAHDVHDPKTAAAKLRIEQLATERRRAELETLYKTSPVALALFDPTKDFTFLNVNDRGAEMLGLAKQDILNRAFGEVAPPESLPGLLEMLHSVAEGQVVKNHLVEGELPARPGELRAWSFNCSPLYNEDGTIRALSAAAMEVTHQRRAESALVQSEKLAAVGRLASSISHEINNPLEAITNLLYLISFDETLSEQVKHYVATAQSELSRVSQIATQTLRFHRQAVKPTLVNAADLVGDVIRLYTGRLANSHVHVEAEYRTTTRILCFENDIRQVLNNLIANAIDAMRTGGRLLIRAHEACDYAEHTLPGDGNSFPNRVRPGIRITIADTGHGMTAEVLARVFEPFYTTKDLNGTGLGLWISSGIVDRHQGRLRVRSSVHPVHHGTVFTLFLPREETTTA